jgi:hypothetical protein
MSMIQDPTPISDQKEMHTAHLDVAHIGDIKGAWGTIRLSDTTVRRTWVARLMTLLIIMGPGLITMTGNIDQACLVTDAQGWDVAVTCLLGDCCHFANRQDCSTRYWALSLPGGCVFEEKYAGSTPVDAFSPLSLTRCRKRQRPI